VPGPERIGRPRLRRVLRLAATAALAAPLLAHAVLGEGLASVAADSQRMGGQRRLAVTGGQQVHSIALADGSTIRQFVAPSGVVYAVAWNTRYKPRLDQLLGAYFPAYVQAGRRALQLQPGIRHHAVLQQGDLVVESSAHLNAHVGRAYLRSLLPAQAAIDAIR
jgi:hypothetical protein